MLVREMMRSPVATIEASARLQEAALLFRNRGFRHLPVMEEGRLVGVLTDRDLRWATSSMCPEPRTLADPVRSAMTPAPVTIDPLDPVEDAARIMREQKIGCLPVTDGPDLVGIVTGMDILDTFLLLTGTSQPCCRIEVSLADRPGELARLTALLAERHVNIHALMTYALPGQPSRTVLRLGSNQSRSLADAITQAGFEVLWPVAKPWSH